MTLQQYLSILPCLPLPSGNLQTPFPSIPWCYLPISSSVFLSFLLLSLSLAELSSPCQRILRCGHIILVSVSLPWLGDHHALQLHSNLLVRHMVSVGNVHNEIQNRKCPAAKIYSHTFCVNSRVMIDYIYIYKKKRRRRLSYGDHFTFL